MILVGIDTGVNTGIALADDGELIAVECMTITQAMAYIKVTCLPDQCKIYIEDARKRKWLPSTVGRERLQGAGSIKRDAGIWEDWCKENGYSYEMVAPKSNRTKLNSKDFKRITGWQGRTNEHSRDGAMLVFGRAK